MLFRKELQLVLYLTLQFQSQGETEGEVRFGFDEIGGVDGMDPLLRELLPGRRERLAELLILRI